MRRFGFLILSVAALGCHASHPSRAVGRYGWGDGFMSSTMHLHSDGTFVSTARGCRGVYGRTRGRWSQRSDGDLELDYGDGAPALLRLVDDRLVWLEDGRPDGSSMERLGAPRSRVERRPPWSRDTALREP